jgi:hypothetical protein
MDAYYQRKEVSNSDLSKLQDLLNMNERPEPTDAYKFGSLIDCMITEPEKVNYFNLTCNDEQYNKEQFKQAESMKKAFYKDELCKYLMMYAEPQKVMSENEKVFNYGSIEYKIDVRCKWDIWMPKFNWGADIKSTTAETQSQFEAAIKFFDYDRQRAWYMNIAGSKQDMIIGISKNNYKVFKVPIRFGDELHTSGVEKYEYLAFEWFRMFGNVNELKNKAQ